MSLQDPPPACGRGESSTAAHTSRAGYRPGSSAPARRSWPSASLRCRRSASADNRSRTTAPCRNRSARSRRISIVLIRRRIDRLDRETHILAHDVRRRLLHPRHFAAHATPRLVGAPQERRQLHEAGFLHQHELSDAGCFANTPSAHKAQHLVFERARLRRRNPRENTSPSRSNVGAWR